MWVGVTEAPVCEREREKRESYRRSVRSSTQNQAGGTPLPCAMPLGRREPRRGPEPFLRVAGAPPLRAGGGGPLAQVVCSLSLGSVGSSGAECARRHRRQMLAIMQAEGPEIYIVVVPCTPAAAPSARIVWRRRALAGCPPRALGCAPADAQEDMQIGCQMHDPVPLASACRLAPCSGLVDGERFSLACDWCRCEAGRQRSCSPDPVAQSQ